VAHEALFCSMRPVRVLIPASTVTSTRINPRARR
jgi:hypothetical protein